MKIEFNSAEIERIHELVVKLIGTKKIANEKAEIFIGNIKRRMFFHKVERLSDYLDITKKSQREFSYLISSLSIHTTYWFREAEHFTILEKMIHETCGEKKIRILSAGSSTGEEAYSIGVVLESIRNDSPAFDYDITGVDIDPVSIATAQKAIYSSNSLSKIERKFHKYVMIGSGHTQGKMTLAPEIRSRIQFETRVT